MNEALEYICDFRTPKELEAFFLRKQKSLSFSLSKPSEFDGEFLPLFCFSYFFSADTKFRLVRKENTIRDAEIQMPGGKIVGIQITQATNRDQMRNHNYHGHRDIFVVPLDKQGKQDGGIVSCLTDELSISVKLVLDILDVKIERYKKLPDYEASETILLIYLSDPSVKMCFSSDKLLSILLKGVSQESLSFFKEVQVVYFQENGRCTLLNITKQEQKSLSVSPGISST